MDTSIQKAPKKVGHWVQVERTALEAWAQLSVQRPRAAQLLMLLVAQMGKENAVGASQKTLAKLMDCSVDTVQRALRDLSAANYIQVVRLNGPGSVAAYVVNDRVAWCQARANLRLSKFSAVLIADGVDQQLVDLDNSQPLQQIPTSLPESIPPQTGWASPLQSQSSLQGVQSELSARKVPQSHNVEAVLDNPNLISPSGQFDLDELVRMVAARLQA